MPKRKQRKSTKKSYSRRKKQKSPFQKTIGNLFKFLLLLAASSFVIYYFIIKPLIKKDQPDLAQPPMEKPVNISDFSKEERLDFEIAGVIREFKIPDSWIQKDKNVLRIRLPNDIPSIVIIHKIVKLVDDLNFDLLSSGENFATHQSILEIGKNDELVRKVILSHDSNLTRNKGKIAIIIDDFGYGNTDQIAKLLNLPYQISCAIIPGLSKSKDFYRLAQQHKKETLIHMPMEAIEEKVEYSDYSIYTNMSDEEITKRINKAIFDYPASKGMNNHMGSKVTSDEFSMEIILRELSKSTKYYIDSKTTNQSVVAKVARKLTVAWASRDIFLERERNDTKDYLRGKLGVTAKIAEQTGSAIAIGHPYKNTIEVLIEEIPKLEKQGFEFVFVSELVK